MTHLHRPICVIVVAYLSADLLDKCLSRLDRKLPVIVIDNSSDQAVRRVSDRHDARYVDGGYNRGFGAGVNLALTELRCGPPVDVLLLNPDAEIDPDFVMLLGTSLHSTGYERVGALSPRVLALDGQEQRVMWPFPQPARAWLEAIGLGRFNGATDFAVGTCLMLRWEALVETGLFDERFFLYAEETDWQRRAHNFGWTSGIVPDVVCHHVGAGTSADADRREAYFQAGTETYIRKWHGPWGWGLYRLAVLIGALARALVLTGSRRSRAWNRARLYLQGPRRSAGLT